MEARRLIVTLRFVLCRALYPPSRMKPFGVFVFTVRLYSGTPVLGRAIPVAEACMKERCSQMPVTHLAAAQAMRHWSFQDSEGVIGNMAGQSVPDPDCAVFSATRNSHPIRTPCHAVHGSRMGIQHECLTLRVRIPDAQGTVDAPADQSIAIGTPGNRVYRSSVTLEDCNRLSGLNIPESDGAVAAAGCHDVSCRTPCN